MRLHRTLIPIVFILFLLFWPTFVQADYLAGAEAFIFGDYATALKEWRPVAEQGDMESQWAMGDLYRFGWGVPQDDGEAARWYRLAAEQGDADAQVNLGNRYRWGQGMTQDYQEAVRWYRLAAEQGQALAQAKLGLMYDKGRGVLQDHVQAHMWLNLAAAQGHEDAATVRGEMGKKMTRQQITEAQRLARKWLAIHQK